MPSISFRSLGVKIAGGTLSGRPALDRAVRSFKHGQKRCCWLGLIVVMFAVSLPAQTEARDGNSVWGGLVLATNQPGQTSGRYDTHPYARRFRKIFGYRYYELLGKDRQLIRAQGGNRLRLGREFHARLRYLGPKRNGLAFALELYRQDRKVVESNVILGRDSPLVIRGPQWGKGQLLFLLMVR